MTMAAPDWYPDPSNNAFQRWWTGQGWSEYTRPNAPFPAADEELPMTYRQRDKAMRRKNGFGWAGAALAIIAIMIDPFGLMSILAIIFSSIGINAAIKLRKSGSSVAGLGWSIIGLILGILTAGYTLFALSRVVTNYFSPHL